MGGSRKQGERNAIRFLLGNKPQEVEIGDPTQTVLEWLREDAGRRGTKEGCAEGDCGACTVVVGEQVGQGDVRYKPVNACIQFMPTLDGRQLITVEDLQDSLGELHPCQTAMIEAHGSQCGYCTPGFVMSLFALYREVNARNEPLTRQEVDDALAGNLCRCTGYGPIASAAVTMNFAEEGPGVVAGDRVATERSLAALTTEFSLQIEGAGKRWLSPRSKKELSHLLDRFPESTLVAGATDVGLWVTKQHRHLETVIYLGDVAELKDIVVDDGAIRIGAGVSYAAAHKTLALDWPDVGEVMRRLGSRQIREMGTIGGNIANGSPIGDSAPMLIALGSAIVLQSLHGPREIPLEDFFIAYGKQELAPGEFVSELVIPRSTNPAWCFKASKVSKRFDQDITAVLGAFNLLIVDGWVQEARVAYGGMAGTPKRARALETLLIGRPWIEETITLGMDKLREDFTPLSDMRASATYRMRVAQNLLKRVWIETTTPDTPTRLAGPAGRDLVHSGNQLVSEHMT